MASFLKSIRPKLKRSTLRVAKRLARWDSSGKLERRLQHKLIDMVGDSVPKMRNLAWVSAGEGDLVMAVTVWEKVAQVTEGSKTDQKSYIKSMKKLAGLETKLRRQVEAFSPDDAPAVLANAPDVGVPVLLQGMSEPTPYELNFVRNFLTSFWNVDVKEMSKASQTALRKAYCDLAAKRIKEGSYYGALKALQPVLVQWPEYQPAYDLHYKTVLKRVTDRENRGDEMLDSWWTLFGARKETLSDTTLEQVWTQSERVARNLVQNGRPTDAERVILPAFKQWPENYSALIILAKAGESRQDWKTAGMYWQLYAAITNPVTTKSRTHVAENPEKMLRKSKYARNELRRARIKQAEYLHKRGKQREFGELVTRIVESVPDQRIFKNDREIIDVVRTYVQDALRMDGVISKIDWKEDNKPIRIAICLDVLKISDVHTHSRVVFAMCRNLMNLDDRIETHIIVTNERFAVTTPVVSMSFNPTKDAFMQDVAKQALPEYYGKRFFLHNYRSIGLEGIIDTCKDIIKINPDVILYGGGHKGMFSNETRVVRHCLYDSFPTAFFYIQANNEVDDKLDMIIARGPHEIIGDKGNAVVRPQPYPTIVEEGFVNEVPIDLAKMERQIIVSAITGVRMDVRMREMDPADMKTMFSLLDMVPGAVWHLIGSTDPDAMVKGNPAIARRVKAGQMVVHPVLPFEEFTTFVSDASLFFHMPGFTGGSGGASVARRAGIPILTFKHSDVSGRQPAAAIFDKADVKGCVLLAARLLKSRKEWSGMVKAQFAHTEWIRQTSAQGFYDCLAETVKISRKRFGTKVVKLADKRTPSAGNDTKPLAGKNDHGLEKAKAEDMPPRKKPNLSVVENAG